MAMNTLMYDITMSMTPHCAGKNCIKQKLSKDCNELIGDFGVMLVLFGLLRNIIYIITASPPGLSLRCAVLVVSHGDPLQILQTILNAAIADDKGSSDNDLTSRIEAVKVPSIISQHRKFALLTGELRAVI